MLADKILKCKKKSIKNYPVHTNRASMIGHPCLRYLVIYRKEWKQRTPITPHLKLVFELGNIFEDKAIDDLRQAGVKIHALQQSYQDDKLGLTAHTDGIIVDDTGKKRIIEIKSSSPMVFPRINSIDDMLNSNYTFMKKYPYQMEAYLMMSGFDEGIWLFVNKSTGEYKEFIQKKSPERQNEIAVKCTAINEHLKAKTTPDCIEYTQDLCGRCDMIQACNPPKPEKNVFLEQDQELIEALDRRGEIIDLKKEYDKIDKNVKLELRGKNGIIGSWLIESKESERKEYTVKASKQIRLNITKI